MRYMTSVNVTKYHLNYPSYMKKQQLKWKESRVSLSDIIHAEKKCSSLGSCFSKHYSTWIIPSLPPQVIYGPWKWWGDLVSLQGSAQRGWSLHGSGLWLSSLTPAEDVTHPNVGRKDLEGWVWDFLNSILPNKINKLKTVAQSERENSTVFMNC